jgi:hypothetical protein
MVASAPPHAANAALNASTCTIRELYSVVLDDANLMLLRQFASEVKTASSSCIALGSCFNAVGFSKTVRLPINIANYAPNPPLQSARSIRETHLYSYFSPRVQSGLKGFGYYLTNMRDELEVVLNRHQTIGFVTSEDVRAANDATGTAACFAKLILKDLVSIESRLAEEYEVAQMNYLMALLDQILEGKSPLLIDGGLAKLRTDFKGRERRLAINADAYVTNPIGHERVIITNISQGGLAIKGSIHHMLAQPIRLKLVDSGRVLSGRVVWRDDDRAGVSFHFMLSEDDELLKP